MIAELGIVLGRGYDWKTVTTSAALTLLLIFYVPFIASLFGIDVYLLIDRTTYYTIFDNEFLGRDAGIIAINVLLVIWILLSTNRRIEIMGSLVLAVVVSSAYFLNHTFLLEILSMVSLPFILLINFVRRFLGNNLALLINNRLTINYLSIVGIGIAVASIYLSLSRDAPVTNITDPFLGFYLILSYFSPIIMFLCIFSVFINLAVRPVLQKFDLIKYLHLDFNSGSITSGSLKYIIIFMILSIFIVSIPFFNPARQDHSNVSVDIIYYERWISELQNSTDTTQFLNKLLIEISGGDRPLSLLLMLPIADIYPGDISGSLELMMPVILAPSLVVVMFFLTRELTKDKRIALLCSFLTAISFQVLVGTYSGYYANWMGLIVMYLSLFFLVKNLRSPSNRLALFSYAALTFTLLFIHSYTWSILVIFTFVFVLVSYFLRFITRKTVVMIYIILASLIAIDVVRSSLGLGPGAIGRDLFTIERTGAGAEQLEIRWSNLVRTVQVYVGGIYGNVFFLSIVFLGSVLLYYNSRHYSSIFILVFFSLGILPLFFADREIMARIVYNIPFQIPAAISLFWFHRHGIMGTVFGVAIAISIIAASIRVAANI